MIRIRREPVNSKQEGFITLTTDFPGTYHEAALEGLIYRINPNARVVRLTQRVQPYDVRHAAYVLRSAAPRFPFAIHLGLVFPTVGTPGQRNIIVQCRRGILVGPDNGILMPAARELGLEAVYEVSPLRHWLSIPSDGFSVLELYASLAAHISLGFRPEEFGRPIFEWSELPLPGFRTASDSLEGEVTFVDSFGNLITSIPGSELARVARFNEVLLVGVNDRTVKVPLLKAYAYAPPGGLLAHINEEGMLEIAAYLDSATRILGAKVGSRVTVTPQVRPRVHATSP